MDDLNEEELWDALKGLFAYDTVKRDIQFENLRAKVKAQLFAMTPRDREAFFLNRIGDRTTSKEARALSFIMSYPYDFLRWLNEDMNCPLSPTLE